MLVFPRKSQEKLVSLGSCIGFRLLVPMKSLHCLFFSFRIICEEPQNNVCETTLKNIHFYTPLIYGEKDILRRETKSFIPLLSTMSIPVIKEGWPPSEGMI